MRIAHIESSMDWGGQELRIVEQTEWLNANGHPCWIIARPGSAILRQAQQRKLPVHELEIRGSANPGTLFALLRFLKRERIQLLDCHGNRDATYGAYVKWLTGIVVIRSRHITNRIPLDPLKRLVWKKGSHGVVVTAGKVREIIGAAGLRPPQDIHVAVAGVDTRRFRPDLSAAALKESLGIPAGHRVIANVGMIRPDKGQLFYVRACKELLARHEGITCIQLGEATKQTAAYRQQVLAEAHDEIATGKIRFLGYKGDIENWLALADIVVIASIGTEAMTRLVAQAFLMKKNVVATTVGGLPEMIEHEHTGLLCPSKDASALAKSVGRLLDDPDLAERLRENAYRHALASMTFEHMMSGMLDYYGLKM